MASISDLWKRLQSSASLGERMQDPGISPQVPLEAQVAPVSRRLAYALVLLAGCLWGTIGTVYHLAGRLIDIDALTVVTLRAGAGALLL